MHIQVSSYLLLSIAVLLYSINDLFVSNKANVKCKDLTLNMLNMLVPVVIPRRGGQAETVA